MAASTTHPTAYPWPLSQNDMEKAIHGAIEECVLDGTFRVTTLTLAVMRRLVSHEGLRHEYHSPALTPRELMIVVEALNAFVREDTDGNVPDDAFALNEDLVQAWSALPPEVRAAAEGLPAKEPEALDA